MVELSQPWLSDTDLSDTHRIFAAIFTFGALIWEHAAWNRTPYLIKQRLVFILMFVLVLLCSLCLYYPLGRFNLTWANLLFFLSSLSVVYFYPYLVVISPTFVFLCANKPKTRLKSNWLHCCKTQIITQRLPCNRKGNRCTINCRTTECGSKH